MSTPTPPWDNDTDDPTNFYGEDASDPVFDSANTAPWSSSTGYLPGAITGSGTSRLALGAVDGVAILVADPVTGYTIDTPNI